VQCVLQIWSARVIADCAVVEAASGANVGRRKGEQNK
jgi:hypothetical protein